MTRTKAISKRDELLELLRKLPEALIQLGNSPEVSPTLRSEERAALRRIITDIDSLRWKLSQE